jgi:hypothetical protein
MKTLLNSLPPPLLIAHILRPRRVIIPRTIQIHAEIENRRPAQPLAARVYYRAVMQVRFGLGDVAVVEIGAQGRGEEAVEGRAQVRA